MQQLPGSLEAGDAAVAEVAKAPRVTLTDIENAINHIYFTTAEKAVDGVFESDRIALETLTLCIVVTKSGYTVLGKSAPASPENFNAELGCKLALDDAKRQLWPLMGFALKERLAMQGKLDEMQAGVAAQANVGKAT